MIRTRVLLVGCGSSTQFFHAPLIRCCTGFEIFGIVSSKSKEAISKLVHVDNVIVFKSFEESLKAKDSFDLVVVATPNEHHFSIAKLSMEYEKHVVVEKPLTATSEEAETLVRIAKEKNVMLSVFQNRQFDR